MSRWVAVLAGLVVLTAGTEGPAGAQVNRPCVDVNTASPDELRRIIHVDAARVDEILRLRQDRPFTSVDELTRVSGIAATRLRDIRAQGLACVVDVEPLTVTIMDVAQGDAIWIENGRSKVLIDAGQSTSRMASFITERGLAGDTIDYMILTHAHFDHHGGMREFFRTAHNITIRRFYENKDAAAGLIIAELRDSVTARATRGQLEYVDTDDPCGDGRAICTHRLDGGASMHILRPLPEGSVNDRSVAVKLVGPDSASFTMWLSGDAEHAAMRFFEEQYATAPGLRVNVLKGNHHGSCNGVSARWLELVQPEWTTFGVSSTNGFGHVHDQAKELHRAAGARWLRTDENGRITFATAGTPRSGYTVSTGVLGEYVDGRADHPAAAATRE